MQSSLSLFHCSHFLPADQFYSAVAVSPLHRCHYRLAARFRNQPLQAHQPQRRALMVGLYQRGLQAARTAVDNLCVGLIRLLAVLYVA